ncbi:tectonin beta-propeller repeat-containing protein 2-like isoform X2 [Dysidea avara]|uniref:tectonin beta-propeller repeat-containing protein 2-like isoform X2 n=1 Tax=Dysidea avara TaxID=196820 RepID=UPI0033263F30
MTTQGTGSNPVLLEKERLDDLLEKLPEVAGLRRLAVHYTCFDVKEPWIALGSNIGLVCVYHSQRNRLFQLHEIKHTVTVVKLSLELNCVAYGSQDGVVRMIFFNQMATEPSEAFVREAHQCAVTALVWNKHRLFSGFSSGKVLVTTVKLNESTCSTSLLLQTGSHVVQLCSRGRYLLVCTLAATFTMQYLTGKLSQIGHQDRKAGPYGACFAADSSEIFVARPGLRLWKAKSLDGTVLSTSKYREALAQDTIPIIPLLGVVPSHPIITDRTQFTMLYLWDNKYVITHNQHALWVLDPSCSGVVASLADQSPIIDITSSGDSVYLLRPQKPPVVKLSIHADYKASPVPPLVTPKESTQSSSDVSDVGSSHVKSGEHIDQLKSEQHINQAKTEHVEQLKTDCIDQIKTEHVEEHTSTAVNVPPQPSTAAINIPTVASTELPQDIPDGVVPVKKPLAPLALAEMSIEDRVHQIHSFPSSVETPSSSIAVQSVLKKKKKKKKKSHSVQDSPIPDRHHLDTDTSAYDDGETPRSDVFMDISHTPITEDDTNMSHTHEEVDALTDSSHTQVDAPTLDDQNIVDDKLNIVDDKHKEQSQDNSDSGPNIVASSSSPISQDDAASVEVVGYSIERIHEDEGHDKLESDHTASIPLDTAEKDVAAVEDQTKPENVTGVDATANKVEVILQHTDDGDDNTKKSTTDSVVPLEDEESTIAPFLPDQLTPNKGASFTSLFKKAIDDMATKREKQRELFRVTSPQPKETAQQPSKTLSPNTDELLANSKADIWSVLSACPSKQGVARIAATGNVLWVIDSKGGAYWYDSVAAQWHSDKHNMEYISSSPSGSIIWGLLKGQSYVRRGITDKSPCGVSWSKVDKEPLKLITVGQSCVWAVNQDGKLISRDGVSALSPEGFRWNYTNLNAGFAKRISFCDDVLWVCDGAGTVHAVGTSIGLSHVKWETVNSILLESVSLAGDGVVWGIDQSGEVLFHCGVAPTSPCGIGAWWNVSTAQPVNAEHSFAGAIANKVSSVIPELITTRIDSLSTRISHSLPVSVIKNTIGSFSEQNDAIRKVTTSSQGVWLLDGKGTIRHNCGLVTGNRYVSVSSEALMTLSLWTRVSASTTCLDKGGLVWALRSTKELFCFDKEGSVMQVECPSTITHITTSSTAVWIVTKKGIYSRNGISEKNPTGLDWSLVDMGLLHDYYNISWLSCGKQVVWMVNSEGVPLMRIGIVSRAESSSLAPAWVEVDAPAPLSQVVVGPEDWLVWACDTHHNVYIRHGVTDTFPLGDKWEQVPDCRAINLCCSNNFVWALSPGGEILCRYGVKQGNAVGDYWKCIAGKFCQISATVCGQLWGINESGRMSKRQIHVLNVCKSHQIPEGDNEDDWDVV